LLPALCGILPARADYQSTVLSQSPQGYWRLNETTLPPPLVAVNSGSVGAAGNGSLIGVNRGIPGAIAGDANTAYQMPGTAGSADGFRVRVPFQSQWNQTGPYSVEFWAKPGQNTTLASPAASVEFIASPVQRNGWLIYQGDNTLATGNGWVFRQYNSTGLANQSGASANMPINVSHWYHIVATFDGTSLRLYVDGTNAATTALAGTARANTNPAISLSFGARSDGASGFFTWNGQMDEAAMYNTALSPARVLAHYQAGTNTSPPTPYSQEVTSDNPVGYWRFGEASEPGAPNAGTLGAAANGKYFSPSSPGQTGPTPATFPGFESGNKAVGFSGSGGYVQIPSLNFSNNNITFTTWVKPNGAQSADAGIVFNRAQFGSGGTYHSAGGLKMDILGGLNLSYAWDGDPEPAGWDSTVGMNDGQWNFVALIVQPDRAVLWVPQGPNPNPATNFANHGVLLFDGATYIGTDPYTNVLSTFRAFNGTIDEVAMFNRALSLGEVYSQYAAAVGGIAPSIFADPQAPAGTLYAGDTLKLTVDAGGTPNLSYQWRKNTLPIGGATASSYTVASAALTDSGTYDVIVSNSSGTSNSASAVVTVSPQASPTFTQNLTVGTRAIFTGGTIKLQVAAVGGGVTYQWKKNGSDLTGQTSSSLTIPGITSANAGTYTVVASNGSGNQTSAAEAITVPTPVAGSYEAYVSADHPISWYRLDDPVSSPNMLDSMGRWDGFWTNNSGPVTLGVPGALSNSPTTAAHFTLANQSWGEVPTLPPPITTGDITYECWARTTDTADNLSPFSTFKNQYGFFFRKSTEPAWRACNGYGELDTGVPFRNGGPTALQSGKWTHLVCTFNASVGQKSYVNGIWDNSGPFVDFSREFNTPLRVGVAGPYTGDIGYWFDGDVDEVAVYNYALSDSQILAHYQSAQFGGGVKPFFTQLPASQTIVSNSATTVSFIGLAQGSYPVTYQWYKNGNPIAGATNTVLNLSGAYSNAALYTLMATNPVGASNVNATFSIIPAGPPFANVTNNLVLHLKFDGNYTDSSGRGNNATSVGAPTIVPGRLGSGALEFSSANGGPFNYLTLGNPTDLQFGANTSFSVAYWVKIPFSGGFPATNGDLPFICSATGSYGNQGITFAPSYKLGGWSYSMNGIVQLYGPNNSINDGNWHHLVHSFDRSGFAVTWLDGVQADSRLMTGAGNLDNTGPINIGQDPTGAYAEIGVDDLDDVAIWRRALTAYEAYAIYYTATNSNNSFDTAGPVNLNIARVGNNIQISWRPGASLGTLLQADEVTGPWTPVGVYVPVYQVAPGAARKFYRVQLN
jgi:hypothetical protein